MQDLERSLRARRADSYDLADRLLVLQRSDAAAELVAKERSRGAATGLVANWAQSFLAVRARELTRALGRLRRAADARLRRAARRADRERELRRISLVDAMAGQLPDAEVVSGPTLSGYRDLVPWPAPLAGLAFGVVGALAAGAGRRRLRTRDAASALGPPVLASLHTDKLIGSTPEVELLASKLVLRAGGRTPRSVVLTWLDDSGEPAVRLAAALEAGGGTAARVEAWDAGPPQEGDAWLALLTLGAVAPEAVAERLSWLTRAGRSPDGLVVVEHEAPA
jgi:hypothetical protein